jgi:hypothetical protein
MEWFRSHHGAPTDPKWLVVAARAGTKPGVVAAVWWALMDHASQSSPRGSVESFDMEAVAAFYGWSVEEVSAVVAALETRGMIVGGELPSWSKRQPKRERSDDSKERVRKWREANNDAKKEPVTPCNAMKRPDREIDRVEEKPPSEAKRKRAGRRERLPEEWSPNEAHATKAETLGLALAEQAEAFREYHGGKGTVLADWDLGFHTWLRNAVRFARGPTPTPAKNGQPQGQPRYHMTAAEVKELYG